MLDMIRENSLYSRICAAVLILVLGVFTIRIVLRLLKKTLERSRLEKAAFSLITSLASAAMYILLALIAASSLGIDVSSIVALASVLTLALSLALQNMVSNIIGGFTILYTAPFHSGNYVEIAGQGGTVQEINMTYTVLSTPDNKIISIPNSAVVAAQIINYSTAPNRRAEVTVCAPFDYPMQPILDALLQAANVEGTLRDPAPAAVITGYMERGVQYSLRFWVSTAEYWDVFFLVNRRVKTIFDQQGIPMTYPQLQVHIRQ